MFWTASVKTSASSRERDQPNLQFILSRTSVKRHQKRFGRGSSRADADYPTQGKYRCRDFLSWTAWWR